MENFALIRTALILCFCFTSFHQDVNASFFYPASFNDTSEWKFIFTGCEENPDPDTQSVYDNLLIVSTGQLVKAEARPYFTKVPTPIALEYPWDNDYVEDMTKEIRTIHFLNKPMEEQYTISYYFPRRALPDIREENKYAENAENAMTRMLVLSAVIFGDSVNYLSMTAFGNRTSTETSKEFIFSHVVFLGAPGDVQNYQSHEIEGTKYPMEMYFYFEDPDCSVLECAYQLVVLVEESEEDNEQIQPVVDTITHITRGLLNEERKFLRKYTDQGLGVMEGVHKKANWRVWGTDLQASHRAYSISSDNRDLLRDLRDTDKVVLQHINETTLTEPFEYEVFKNGHVLDLDRYVQISRELLNAVDQFLDAASDGSLSVEGLDILLEDFLREKDEIKGRLDVMFNDPIKKSRFSIFFFNSDPLAEASNTTLQKYRIEVNKIAREMEVLAKKRGNIDKTVVAAGFTSGVQAHNFAPEMARRVAGEIKTFQENEIPDPIKPILQTAREATPKVTVVGEFHIAWLFPKRGGHFYYDGSTPFPPCHTVFKTIVFDWPVKMSRSQIKALTTLPADGDPVNDITNTRPPFFELNSKLKLNAKVKWDSKNHQWAENDGFQESSVERARQKANRGNKIAAESFKTQVSFLAFLFYLVF